LLCYLGVSVILLGSFFRWASTYRLEATSPDRRLIARVYGSTAFGGWLAPVNPMIRVELQNNETGSKVTVERYEQGGIMGKWKEPLQIVWTSDSQWFCLISNSTDFFTVREFQVYHLTTKNEILSAVQMKCDTTPTAIQKAFPPEVVQIIRQTRAWPSGSL
jgi:hypothetical protein